MQRAEMVPPSEDHLAQLRQYPGGEKVIAEIRNCESWRNDRYVTIVTRHPELGHVMELSIRRADRKAVHDWRDFQRIKNEIAGTEVEAFEMYPAESRLMDTANQYYLFCLAPGETIPAGYTGPRNVADPGEIVKGSVQRPLPKDWRT